MAIVVVLILCVLIIAIQFGVGIADFQGAFGAVGRLFPEGYFPAWWDSIRSELGFHLNTLVLGIVIGMAVVAFSRK